MDWNGGIEMVDPKKKKKKIRKNGVYGGGLKKKIKWKRMQKKKIKEKRKRPNRRLPHVDNNYSEPVGCLLIVGRHHRDPADPTEAINWR